MHLNAALSTKVSYPNEKANLATVLDTICSEPLTCSLHKSHFHFILFFFFFQKKPNPTIVKGIYKAIPKRNQIVSCHAFISNSILICGNANGKLDTHFTNA